MNLQGNNSPVMHAIAWENKEAEFCSLICIKLKMHYLVSLCLDFILRDNRQSVLCIKFDEWKWRSETEWNKSTISI